MVLSPIAESPRGSPMDWNPTIQLEQTQQRHSATTPQQIISTPPSRKRTPDALNDVIETPLYRQRNSVLFPISENIQQHPAPRLQFGQAAPNRFATYPASRDTPSRNQKLGVAPKKNILQPNNVPRLIPTIGTHVRQGHTSIRGNGGTQQESNYGARSGRNFTSPYTARGLSSPKTSQNSLTPGILRNASWVNHDFDPKEPLIIVPRSQRKWNPFADSLVDPSKVDRNQPAPNAPNDRRRVQHETWESKAESFFQKYKTPYASPKEHTQEVTATTNVRDMHLPGEWPDSCNESQIVYVEDSTTTTITRVAQKNSNFKRRCVDISTQVSTQVTNTTKTTMHTIVRAVRCASRVSSLVGGGILRKVAGTLFSRRRIHHVTPSQTHAPLPQDQFEKAMDDVHTPTKQDEPELPPQTPSNQILRQLAGWDTQKTGRISELRSLMYESAKKPSELAPSVSVADTTPEAISSDEAAVDAYSDISSFYDEDLYHTILSDRVEQFSAQEDLPVHEGSDVSEISSTYYSEIFQTLIINDETPVATPSPEANSRRRTRLQKKQAEELEAARKLEAELQRKPFEPLSDEWDEKVSDALMKGFGNFSRSDLTRVVPTGRGGGTEGWLNDEVINAYLKLIVDHGNSKHAGQSKRYHAFNSFFYTNIHTKGYSSVSRWARRAKIDATTIKQMDAIYIPINSGAHWTLLVIYPSTKRVIHFDSLGGSGRNAIAAAKQWLAGELAAAYVDSDWAFFTEGESPQQSNFSDCGVFAITTAKMLTLGVNPMAYGPADIPAQRRRIIAELMQGGFF